MRRADRLFRIVQLLRRRRTITTAAQLASKLEISERTVYRDIRDLILAGTPIDGAAGVGYRLRPDYDLPPLMFDREEIQALVLGARIVRQFGDPALAIDRRGNIFYAGLGTNETGDGTITLNKSTNHGTSFGDAFALTPSSGRQQRAICKSSSAYYRRSVRTTATARSGEPTCCLTLARFTRFSRTPRGS